MLLIINKKKIQIMRTEMIDAQIFVIRQDNLFDKNAYLSWKSIMCLHKFTPSFFRF